MFQKSTFLVFLAFVMSGNTCTEQKPQTLDRSQLLVDASQVKGVEAAKRLCNPDYLAVYPEEAPFNVPPWTAESLGTVPGQGVADKLNSIKNGRTRIYLGQCLRYASDKLNKGIETGDLESVALAAEALEYYYEVLDMVMAKHEQMLKSGG